MDRTASREGASRARRREHWQQRAERARDAFGLVLLLVLLTYVLTSLLDNRDWSAVVLLMATSATSIVALTSSHSSAGAVRGAIWVSGLTILLGVVAAVSGAHLWLNFASGIQIALLAVSMAMVLRRVVSTADVGSRTILGAISVYTVMGILFTFLYSTIDRIQSTPFFEGHPNADGSDFIFFSYTTLTTTGYGNLVPDGQPGEMIAGLEMMIGQIFLVTLVAGLVSLWRPGERLRNRRDRNGGGESPAPESAA